MVIDGEVLLNRVMHSGKFTALAKRHFETIVRESVRRGEWKPAADGSGRVQCSFCLYEYRDPVECGNFCGNCGADMRPGGDAP